MPFDSNVFISENTKTAIAEKPISSEFDSDAFIKEFISSQVNKNPAIRDKAIQTGKLSRSDMKSAGYDLPTSELERNSVAENIKEAANAAINIDYPQRQKIVNPPIPADPGGVPDGTRYVPQKSEAIGTFPIKQSPSWFLSKLIGEEEAQALAKSNLWRKDPKEAEKQFPNDPAIKYFKDNPEASVMLSLTNDKLNLSRVEEIKKLSETPRTVRELLNKGKGNILSKEYFDEKDQRKYWPIISGLLQTVQNEEYNSSLTRLQANQYKRDEKGYSPEEFRDQTIVRDKLFTIEEMVDRGVSLPAQAMDSILNMAKYAGEIAILGNIGGNAVGSAAYHGVRRGLVGTMGRAVGGHLARQTGNLANAAASGVMNIGDIGSLTTGRMEDKGYLGDRGEFIKTEKGQSLLSALPRSIAEQTATYWTEMQGEYIGKGIKMATDKVIPKLPTGIISLIRKSGKITEPVYKALEKAKVSQMVPEFIEEYIDKVIKPVLLLDDQYRDKNASYLDRVARSMIPNPEEMLLQAITFSVIPVGAHIVGGAKYLVGRKKPPSDGGLPSTLNASELTKDLPVYTSEAPEYTPVQKPKISGKKLEEPPVTEEQAARDIAPAGKQSWEITRREYANNIARKEGFNNDFRSRADINRVASQEVENNNATTKDLVKYEDEVAEKMFGVKRKGSLSLHNYITPEQFDTFREKIEADPKWQSIYAEVAKPKQQGDINKVQDAFTNHGELVKQALSEGKPVPPEVLADYPELKNAPESTTIDDQAQVGAITPPALETKAGKARRAKKVGLKEETQPVNQTTIDVVETNEPVTSKEKIGRKIKTKAAEIIPNKEELLKQFDEAIKTAPSEKGKTTEAIDKLKENKLHFEIDGGVNIYNTKEALQTVRDKIKALPNTEQTAIGKVRKKSTGKVSPIAAKQEHKLELVPTESKEYITDGKIILKSEAPKNSKIIEREKYTTEKPIPNTLINALLNESTDKAELSHYAVRGPEVGEGASLRPVPKMGDESVPHVIFKSKNGYSHYDQSYFNMIRNRFPDATYGVSQSGMLVAYENHKPVAVLMGIATEEGGRFTNEPSVPLERPVKTKTDKPTNAKETQNEEKIDGFNENKPSGGTDGKASMTIWTPEMENQKNENTEGETSAQGPNIPDRQIFNLIDLVDMAKKLMDGKFPSIVRRIRLLKGTALGVFMGEGGIKLKNDIFIGPQIVSGTAKKERANDIVAQMIFNVVQRGILKESDIAYRITMAKQRGYVTITLYRKDAGFAAKVLAHEIGHLWNWLSDKSDARGNILGMIGSMHKYIKTQLEGFPGGPGTLTAAEKAKLRRRAKQLLNKDIEVEMDEEIRQVLGITPEDVIKIWNSTMDMRKISPDLYNYIAALSGAQKKAIILDAMKGKISDELLQFAKVVITKTGKKIKQTIKQEQTPEAIADKYRELFEAEVRKRGIIEIETILKELKALTEWWNPIHPNADAKYKQYRFSNDELYAEAISVLLNNPAALEQRAPMFNKAFFGWFSRKPEVSQAYNNIVAAISAGMSVDKAVAKKVENYKKAEEKYLDALSRKWFTLSAAWKSFLVGLIDKAKITKKMERQLVKVGKKKIADVTEALDFHLFTKSGNELYLAQFRREIYDILRDANVDFDDFNLYCDFMNYIHNRSEMANPGGFTVSTSQKALDNLKQKLGSGRYALLEQAHDALWKIREANVINKQGMSNIAKGDLLAAITERKFYAPVMLAKFFEKKYGKVNGVMLHKMIGTFEDEALGGANAVIKNDMALMEMVDRNNAKMSVVDLLLEFNPDLIEIAEKQQDEKGYTFKESDDPSKKLMIVMRNGEPVGYNVDEWHALTFEKTQSHQMELAARIARWTGAPFRMIFTGIRPGFQAFNVIRDLVRAKRNVPTATWRKFLPMYIKAIAPAFRSTFGGYDATAEEMLREHLFISVQDVLSENASIRLIERQMKMFEGTQEYKNKAINPIFYFHAYLRTGQALERIPKIAAFNYLNKYKPEMSVAERNNIIRTRAGSPSFLTAGQVTWLTNNVFIFSRAMINGWDSDIQAFQDYKGDYAKSMFTDAIVPKAIQWSLKSGAMLSILLWMGYDDDDKWVQWAKKMKRMYSKIGKYNLVNFICVPLWERDDGTVAFLRVPTDEISRFVAGTFHLLLESPENGIDSIPALTDYMAGQAPTLNPALKVAFDTVNYVTGRNPYDYYRQRNAVPETTFTAGGWGSHKAFLKYEANQLGFGIIKRFNESDMKKETTGLETFVNAPFISDTLGRFIQVTDRGTSESLRKVSEQVDRERAREIIAVKAAVDKKARGGSLTDEEKKLIKDNKATVKSREKKLDAKDNRYESELLYAKSTKARYAMQLEILRIEGKDYNLAPLIESDILAMAKKLMSKSLTRKEFTETVSWLRERNISGWNTEKAYWKYLQTLKADDKGERMAELSAKLQSLRNKNKGLKK